MRRLRVVPCLGDAPLQKPLQCAKLRLNINERMHTEVAVVREKEFERGLGFKKRASELDVENDLPCPLQGKLLHCKLVKEGCGVEGHPH